MNDVYHIRRFIVNDNNMNYAYFINKVKREIVVIVEALSFVYTSDSSGEWSCLHTVINLNVMFVCTPQCSLRDPSKVT